MIPIQTKLDSRRYTLGTLKDALRPIGFVVGDNWEYDHAHLDYKVDDQQGDQPYIRIPFAALDDSLEDDRTTIKLGTPFLLEHEFKTDVDEDGNIGAAATGLNQFKEPDDEDAPFPDEYKDFSLRIMEQVESALEGKQVME
ncbi:YugN family protein [Peribacillus kribbensis]|uniref:YugN family protein n=1 Tax=Peribacillus kribbensis TaxID=356658 RepID=UPI00041D2497|nr:YugN family protein [Peribacillus kribbensis]